MPDEKQLNVSNSSLHNWFTRGQYLELCGNTIFTLDEGSAQQSTIVLIHGYPTSSWDWAPIWQELLPHYRLVCLDMLGFGFSDKPDRRDYTIHQQADLFEAYINELSLTKYHVLAHDYGDSVAQELLARQLQGVGKGDWESCCFLNGGLFPETHRALFIQKLMLSPLGKLINKITGFKQFKVAFSAVFGTATKPDEQLLKAIWELINFNNGKHLFHNLITYILDRREYRERWVHAIQNSPVPLSIINGSADPISGAHMVARYKELNCRLDHLLELPEIGHYPHVEAPKTLKSAYLKFLNKTNIRA